MNILSPSAKKRLPVAIKNLPETERAVFVFLRLRRDETFIARELKVSLETAHNAIKNVQDALVKSGALDLIQDPVFYPIDAPQDGNGAGIGFELESGDMPAESQIALERFYRVLAESLEKISKNGRRLLGLWFNKEMTAKDILRFYSNLGLPILSGKPISETTQKDVFHEIEKNIRKLADIVRSNYNEKETAITPLALRSILEETGV
ncbi:hypothetical protein MNBD_NITROSPINAE01-525 [hydrothermal vent metagenome]|uniref:Uncharacterized protein n=1 Tax=hydrothermal vent metagenome TaxID=652676 RepID=A0A3B1BY14_9ZZZZ